MNRLPALLIACTVLGCIAWTAARTKRKPPVYEVSGKVLILDAYCGGVRPIEDPKPYPVKGTMLYVRHASRPEKVIDSIVTDSLGQFKIKLAYGQYCLVEKWKTEPFAVPADTKFEKWDSACYRTVYHTCDYTLDVKSKMKEVSIQLNRTCAWTRPCCRYSGPKPPAAAPVNRGGYQPGHQE
jgi:hypothetical protein